MKDKLQDDWFYKGSFAALKRASKRARKIAEETNTPFYVWKDGKVVNLIPGARNTKKKRFPPLL
jgi:hypothetical protein